PDRPELNLKPRLVWPRIHGKQKSPAEAGLKSHAPRDLLTGSAGPGSAAPVLPAAARCPGPSSAGSSAACCVAGGGCGAVPPLGAWPVVARFCCGCALGWLAPWLPMFGCAGCCGAACPWFCCGICPWPLVDAAPVVPGPIRPDRPSDDTVCTSMLPVTW